MGVLLCERVNDLHHSHFLLFKCLITTASKFFLELRELPKVTENKVWTIERLSNCLDAHLDKIVCDKDGVVEWVHCPGGNATDPIWRVLACSWTPLKPHQSIPCWLSSGNPVHVDHTSAGRASMLPLGTQSLGLWVIAVDPDFIAGHQRIKNYGIWIDQHDHLPAVMTTSFFLIFSEHPWDKLSANLPHLQFLGNNCVYSSHTDIKLCIHCLYRHTTVVIHEILFLANQLWCSGFLTPPTPLIIPHRFPAFL